MVQFNKAVKTESRLRMALIGPAGSGKTYTALQIAQELGGPIALMDTEHGSASKYADLFAFDALAPDTFPVEVYIEAIKAAEAGGYNVLILDSLSHAWAGKGGLLEFVDTETAKSRSHNAFSEGWRKATPKHNQLIDAMLAARLHLIVTMRTKTEYVVEQDDRGHSAPRKIGLQPVQRDGLEYEFDVIGDLDYENRLVIGKTRCPELTGKTFIKAGKDVADILKRWLSGAPVEHKPEPTVIVKAGPNGERIEEPAGGNGKNGNSAPPRPFAPDVVRKGIQDRAAPNTRPPAETTKRQVVISLNKVVVGGDLARYALTNFLIGKEHSADFTDGECKALIAWIGATKESDWEPNAYAVDEARAILALVAAEQGVQLELPAEVEAAFAEATAAEHYVEGEQDPITQ